MKVFSLSLQLGGGLTSRGINLTIITSEMQLVKGIHVM